MREDLKENTKYGRYYFVKGMEHCAGVTIKQYNATLKAYSIIKDSYNYSLEMFDQVINEPKENNMETKEIKINIPEGYEIDEENSTFECIKLKPISINKNITYYNVGNSILKAGYYITERGEILYATDYADNVKLDKNNATNKKQLKRLLALNQLLNIAEYYNKKNLKEKIYCINFDKRNHEYFIQDYTYSIVVRGLIPIFNNKEDAKAVIDNSNFKEILDLIYKFDED